MKRSSNTVRRTGGRCMSPWKKGRVLRLRQVCWTISRRGRVLPTSPSGLPKAGQQAPVDRENQLHRRDSGCLGVEDGLEKEVQGLGTSPSTHTWTDTSGPSSRGPPFVGREDVEWVRVSTQLPLLSGRTLGYSALEEYPRPQRRTV